MDFYTNPTREPDPHVLPDAEVFYVDAESYNERHSIFWAIGKQTTNSDDPADYTGWYWWICFPGCLPDSDPNGPFDTEKLAIADAQEQWS